MRGRPRTHNPRRAVPLGLGDGNRPQRMTTSQHAHWPTQSAQTTELTSKWFRNSTVRENIVMQTTKLWKCAVCLQNGGKMHTFHRFCDPAQKSTKMCAMIFWWFLMIFCVFILASYYNYKQRKHWQKYARWFLMIFCVLILASYYNYKQRKNWQKYARWFLMIFTVTQRVDDFVRVFFLECLLFCTHLSKTRVLNA